jgi:predicted NAD/FAD-binding protein
MRVAVVGSGIAGLACAARLHGAHEVTLFEAEDRLGGHASTLTVEHEGRRIAVDTGFIVYNERNYPLFSAMLRGLGVATMPAPMSFSVRCDRSGVEYGGGSLRGLLARPANLLRPRFLRMLAGVRSLGRTGRAALASCPEGTTMGDLIESGVFSRDLADLYLVPMASAIWSAPRRDLMRFPARFFLGFFDNHGMLELRERPRWRTVRGGSREYVRALAAPLEGRCRLSCPVRSVRRGEGFVEVESAAGVERFDHAVIAAHADQALRMLADPSEEERAVLSAMPYQPNDCVLHTDPSLLPGRRAAWSAWNYLLTGDADAPPIVTYNLSILQSLPEGERARSRWAEISGPRRTHYCGAYWFNGFHEDGVRSAARVCGALGAAL